jgi:hypothetical protein
MALRVAQTPLIFEDSSSGHLRVSQGSLIIETGTTPSGQMRVAQCVLIIEQDIATSPPPPPTFIPQPVAARQFNTVGQLVRPPSSAVITLTGGAFQDLAGNPVSYGYLIARLVENGAFTGYQKLLDLGYNGSLVGATISATSTLVAGSFYKLDLYNTRSVRQWSQSQILEVPATPSSQSVVGLITLVP